jgi:hypothetical protein
VAVAQRLGAQGADHLRVAVVATLADVDVAAGELHRVERLQAGNRLRRRALEEQRHDLDDPADRDDQQDQHDHQEIVGLDPLVAGGRARGAHEGVLEVRRPQRSTRRAGSPGPA